MKVLSSPISRLRHSLIRILTLVVKDFTWLLLRSNPKERMTMKNAVKHAWIHPSLNAMRRARNELVKINVAESYLNYREDYRIEGEEPET